MQTLEAVVEALRWFEPFKHMDSSDVLVLATKGSIDRAPAHRMLFEAGKGDPWLYCLLDGTVELKALDGQTSSVVGKTAQAWRPLSPRKPRLHTATSVTPVAFVKLDVSDLGDIEDLFTRAEYTVHEIPQDGAQLSEQIQLHELTMLSEGLQLLSLPEAALRARQLLDKPEVDLGDLARIVTKDPALTAKLLKAANSALYRRGRPVQTCDQAIVRLGLKVTAPLIMAFAMRGLFESDSPQLRSRLRRSWEHANEVAAISFVLARLTGKFDAEEAMLAGLLHDIGALPILAYLARHPTLLNDAAVLDQLVTALRVRAGVNVIREWKLPEQFETVIRDSEDWWRDPGPEPDLADVIVVAKIHAEMNRPERRQLPSLVNLPAFRKLAGADAGPQLSQQILAEAAGQIAEARSLLG